MHTDPQQPVLVAIQALERDGVVEVFGVLTVDGEGRHLAVIGAALHHLARHVVGHGGGLGDRGGVVLGLEVVLDDDGARLDLGVVRGAEVLDHLAERFALA